MDLYFAPGGGAGHLTRAIAFLHTIQLNSINVKIVCSVKIKIDLPGYTILNIPEKYTTTVEAFKSFIRELISSDKPETIYIDTFYNGILGEWNRKDYPNIRFVLIARNLDFTLYSSRFTKQCADYSICYVVDNLSELYAQFLKDSIKNIKRLILQYPVFEPDVKALAWLNSVKAPVWAIIHSQPVDEVLALYDHACDMSVYELEPPQICVFTFEQLSVNHPVFTIYPVWPLLPYFSRVFMACGFNSLNQTAKYKDKCVIIPFKRTYDNQFYRFKNY